MSTATGGILDQYFLATFLNVSGVELPLYAVWVVIGVLLLLVIILAVMLCVRKSNTKKEFVVQLNVSADQNNIPTDPVTFKAGEDVSVRLVDAGNPDRPREGLRVDKVLNKNGWNILKNKVHPNYNNANPVDVGSEW